jgi:galactofuranosylgalactofuranosylrhamnosyl-N-acetylglucosaminyl-diphospho-decaprenol beta-1,5/1,6-galactofuranosyltransferase
MVREVIVVDQGATLAQHPGFRRLRQEHDGLRLITQQNLGGSGGYARGMLEASAHPEDAVLLSDDDAVLSEESLRRMLLLQALTPQRTIVGTPLFDADRPGRLLAHAEAVSPQDFQWRASDGVHEHVDLRGTDPSAWTFLVESRPPNYTGWWGTLLPPGTADDLGLPAPFFLKWDDAEFGLRATRRGYGHAVLPGTSVHHPGWNAHRTQMAWPARMLHRNRLTTAAVHGSGRRVVLSSLLHQIKHVLAGHHLTAELWESGIDSFLAGPEAWLGSDLARARTDSQQVVDAWRAAHPLPADLPAATEIAPPPLLLDLARATALLLRRGAPVRRRVRRVSADALRWRSTLGADAVVVTDAQGRGVDLLAPVPAEGRAMLRRTLVDHARLTLAWRRLARRYRGALPRLIRAEAWIPLFEGADASPASDRRRGPWTREPTP